MGQHGLDEGQPGSDIVAEILLGHLHTLPPGEGGEVDDRLDGLPGKYIVQEGPVGYAAHIEAAALEGLPVALGQVVHHHHVGPRSIRAATQWLPIYPAPPVTRIAIAKTSFLL